MKVSVIIVNYNVKYFLEVCIHSVLRAAEGYDVEVIVVDNNSADGSCAFLRTHFPQVVLIANTDNKGFSKANNQGVAIAKGEYVLFLNPDTVMPEDFFSKTIPYMDAHPEVGSLGPRLIDGVGQFAPDGKKSFPTFSVAVYKTTGINKLFSKSAYFNKYYAVHIGERETAPVEVLSGCCMLVRTLAMQQAGGAFDEDYFMYCEDVDLSYRIQKAGYKNVYYPEVDLIHYKGESTKKMTLSYVRIFNEALVTFVKKHYSKKDAQLFVFFIHVGIVLRAVLGTVKRGLKILHMPLIDALLLLLTLLGMKAFWVNEVKGMTPIPLSSVSATFPAYIGLWLVSMFFSGAYDNPYRAIRVIRGMMIGTLVTLAYYGLLPPELRYSRAIIIFSGFTGTIALLGMHELLYKLGILRYVPYDKLPKKAVIVASEGAYRQTAATLRQVHYAPEITGRIAVAAEDHSGLAHLSEMRELLLTTGVNEVIFCVNGLTYNQIFEQMQHCGPQFEYKIHLPGSESFVGSNSSFTSGDLYTLDKSYDLNDFSKLRSKRVLDVLCALGMLLLLPILLLVVKAKGGFIKNVFVVLVGAATWVGYSGAPGAKLPKIKKGVLPPYIILPGYEPNAQVVQHINTTYAQHYNPLADLMLILKNMRYLGNA